MPVLDDTEPNQSAIVKQRSFSLQKASSGLIQRGIADARQLIESHAASAEKMLREAESYYFGEGKPQDARQAFALFMQAATLGNAVAEAWVGYCYYYGKGIKQDFTQSGYWFRKAADKGDALAMFALSSHYRRGEGVPKDEAKAREWLRKAGDYAKQENHKAGDQGISSST